MKNINRKLVLRILIASIVLAGVFVLKIYIFEGKLVIQTSPGTTISLLKDSEQKIGVGNTTKRLSGGDYLIQASKGNSITRATATIKARKTTIISMNVITPKTPETVIKNQTAKSMNVLADKSFIYLNSPYHMLFKYSPDGTNPTRYMSDIYPIKQVDWLQNSGAIININDGLSYLDNTNNMHNLDLLTSTYGVSKNGTIGYVVNGYLMVTPPVFSAMQVLKLPPGGYSLAVSDDGRYIFGSATIGNADSTKSTNNPTNYIWDAKTPENIISLPSDSLIIGTKWSPDNVLVYAVGSKIITYKMADQNKQTIMTSIKNYPVALLGFVDSSNLIFAQDSSIWKLNIGSGISYKLGSYEGSVLPTSFSYQDKSIYFSTSVDSGGRGGNIYTLDF